MYDTGKIIAGLIIFVCLATFPFWSNLGNAAPAANPELPKDQKACIENTQWMKGNHMQLLNDWRNEVVRYQNRVYTAEDGKEYNISLQNTCMECHTSKANFCDRCHNYAGAQPYCWTCHVAPEEKKAPEEKG